MDPKYNRPTVPLNRLPTQINGPSNPEYRTQIWHLPHQNGLDSPKMGFWHCYGQKLGKCKARSFTFHAVILIAWLADGHSLMCCIVTLGRQMAKMFSTFSLWGSLFRMILIKCRCLFVCVQPTVWTHNGPGPLPKMGLLDSDHVGEIILGL